MAKLPSRPDRISESETLADSATDSYERTNEQNEEIGPDSNHLQTATCGRVQSIDDPMSLADVIVAGFMHTGERFEIVKTGEREPIPWHVRAAVYYRDEGRCAFCKEQSPKPWNLDHIIPWSAGGPDRTENLRVLCERCNMRRSNYDDRATFAKRPATWWCHRCYGPEQGWNYAPNGLAACIQSWERRHRCRVEMITTKQVLQGETPTWHQRQPVETLTLIAFCAHCNAPGLTDQTL